MPPTAGTFALTGDLSFGNSFGLVVKYLISETNPPASAGYLRLGKTDAIEWRNNANSANNSLAIDGSDNLTYNGLTIQFNGTVNPGTANQLAYYPASSNAVSGLTSITANRALVSDSNGLPIASGVTSTELGYVSGVTSSIQTQLNTLSSEIGAGQVPTGTLLDFAGASAPTGYLLCNGSAVSRTTYANLFGVINTIWGVGDGSTTFNIPDFRRSVAVGSGGSGTAVLGNTVGNTGGEETHVLITPEIPASTVTDPGHNHTQNAHLHNISDPSHSHNASPSSNFVTSSAGGSAIATAGSGAFTEPIRQSLTGGATTGISVLNATATNNANVTGITVAGGGGAHNNIQPSAIVTKIIKI